jgi:hypothetical protein
MHAFFLARGSSEFIAVADVNGNRTRPGVSNKSSANSRKTPR